MTVADVGWPRPAGHGPVVALGKLVADQVLQLSAPLVVGGQQRVVRTTTAGGAPANVTANLARLGVPARLVGWAGADPLADELLAALAERGIETAVVRRGRTPVSTVLVHPDGERTLLSDGGEGGLEPDDVRAEWLAGAAVLHLDGYDLLRYPAALVRAAALAREAGVPVSADVAAASRIEAHGARRYAALLAELRADVLFCNAAEAAALGWTRAARMGAGAGVRARRCPADPGAVAGRRRRGAGRSAAGRRAPGHHRLRRRLRRRRAGRLAGRSRGDGRRPRRARGRGGGRRRGRRPAAPPVTGQPTGSVTDDGEPAECPIRWVTGSPCVAEPSGSPVPRLRA